MSAYRKKPIVIEAVQITAATFDAPHPNPEHIPGVVYAPMTRCAYIDTLEGRMRADLGDWIVRGVKGELYPCKPDIFAATYEPADTPAARPVIKRSDVLGELQPNDTYTQRHKDSRRRRVSRTLLIVDASAVTVEGDEPAHQEEAAVTIAPRETRTEDGA